MDSDLDIIEAACRPGPFIDEEGWAGLTEAQQQLISIVQVDAQVSNGGFHAVYYNDCAPYMPLALLGLERIGIEDKAGIVRAVIRLMNDDPWAGPPETWPDPDQLDSPPGSGDIGEYDDRWYDLDSAAMWRQMAKYIADHPEQFAPVDA